MSITQTTSEQLLERLHAVSFCQLLRCIQIEHGTRVGMVRELEKQPFQLIADLDSSFAANEIVEWWCFARTLHANDPRTRSSERLHASRIPGHF